MNGEGSGCGWPSTLTWRSSIASSRADWVFGGVRLISSASSRLVKTGPGPEGEVARARVEHQRAGEVAGHQVGGELHPLGLDVERGGQGAHEQRLGDAGHALEQDVAAAEQRHEQAGDGGVLADDGLGHLGPHGQQRGAGALGVGGAGAGRHGGGAEARRRGRRAPGIRPRRAGVGGGRAGGVVGHGWRTLSSRSVSCWARWIRATSSGGAGPNRMSATSPAGRPVAGDTACTRAAGPAPRPTASRPGEAVARAGAQHGGGAAPVAGPAVEAPAALGGLDGAHHDGQRLAHEAAQPAAAGEGEQHDGDRAAGRSAGPVHGGHTEQVVRGVDAVRARGPGRRRCPAGTRPAAGVEPSARTAVPALLSSVMLLVGPGRAEAGDHRRRGVPRWRRAAPWPRRSAPSGSGSSGGPSGEGSTKHERAPGASSVEQVAACPTPRRRRSGGRPRSRTRRRGRCRRRGRPRPAGRAAPAARSSTPSEHQPAGEPGRRGEPGGGAGAEVGGVADEHRGLGIRRARLERVDRAHHLDLDALAAQHLGQRAGAVGTGALGVEGAPWVAGPTARAAPRGAGPGRRRRRRRRCAAPGRRSQRRAGRGRRWALERGRVIAGPPWWPGRAAPAGCARGRRRGR